MIKGQRYRATYFQEFMILKQQTHYIFKKRLERLSSNLR